jgi:septal ring factor EnvC (AmiA/AmiB activator)
MFTITRKVTIVAVALLFLGSMALVGCSSKPDDAQMKQLNDLKDEVAALQKEVAAKEQEKAALQKELAEKNAKVAKVKQDQQIVKQRLGK